MTTGAATLIHSVTVFGADAVAAPRADGWVLFEDGVVRDTGIGGHAHAAAVAETVVDSHAVAGPGAILTPRLVDIHVHGGGGHAFDDGAEAIAGAVAAHLQEGTTRIVASLVSAPLPDLRDRPDAVARVVRQSESKPNTVVGAPCQDGRQERRCGDPLHVSAATGKTAEAYLLGDWDRCRYVRNELVGQATALHEARESIALAAAVSVTFGAARAIRSPLPGRIRGAPSHSVARHSRDSGAHGAQSTQ